MITLRVWIVTTVMATVMAGGTAWSAMIQPASAFEFTDSSTLEQLLDAVQPRQVPPRLDIYGNEVEDAVGDYRVDPVGETYESHSPDTEVPRLTAPVI